jgi:hypothetical protein
MQQSALEDAGHWTRAVKVTSRKCHLYFKSPLSFVYFKFYDWIRVSIVHSSAAFVCDQESAEDFSERG